MVYTSDKTLGPAIHIFALIHEAHEVVIALHLESVQANEEGTAEETCRTCDERGTRSPEQRRLIGGIESSHC